MTQKSSSVKTDQVLHVFRTTVERMRGIFFFYCILLTLLGPAAFLLQALSKVKTSGVTAPEFLFRALPLLLAVLFPLMLFGYVNNKPALDLYHAAPVRRKTLYAGQFLAGLSMTIGPYLLLSLVMMALRKGFYGTMAPDVLWLVNIFSCAFATFGMMVFVVMGCGTLFESVVYFLAINGSYPVLLYTVNNFFEAQTFGYWVEDITANKLFSLFPYFTVLFNSEWEQFRVSAVIFPVLLGALLAILGSILYTRRKSEAAGQSFAYKPLFYVGALFSSVGVGLVFLMLSSWDEPVAPGGVVLSVTMGLVTYFVLDTIRNRGFKRLKQTALTSCGAALIVLSFFFLADYSGGFGYENRLPLLSKVSRVEIVVDADLGPGYSGNYYPTLEITLEEPETIALVQKFHQAVVDARPLMEDFWYGRENSLITNDRNGARMLRLSEEYDRYAFDDGQYAQSDYGITRAVKLRYHLRDGGVMNRVYTNIPFVLTKPLAQMLETKEYVSRYFENLIQYDSKNPPTICDVSSLRQNGNVRTDLDEKRRKQLYEALAADVRARPANILTKPQEAPLYRLDCEALREEQSARYRSSEESIILFGFDKNTKALLEQWNALPKHASEGAGAVQAQYLPKSQKDALLSYQNRNLSIFYATGRNIEDGMTYVGDSDKMWTPEVPRFYEPRTVSLTAEEYEKLLSMIAPIRFTQKASDVVIIYGESYLVYPEFEEQVRAMMLSAPDYVEE